MRGPSDDDADRLEDLLDEWETGRRSGEERSTEDLCADCPELAGDLGRRIAKLRAWEEFQRSALSPRDDLVLPSVARRHHPDRIDRYEIVEKIGEGGMGVVYRARHTSMGRYVALKVLPAAAVDSPEKVRRFRQEVRAAGHLSHPNIVTAYDAGEADGLHFLVMEFIEGEDLDHLVARRGPLPVPEAVSIIGQAAVGLQYAHQAGVVHRDVKPKNLIRATNGTIKVLDLGLARLHGPAPDGGSIGEMVSSDGFFGTASYASPEQALESRRADRRTDVYSLGCVLHHLLTGRPPYLTSSVMQTLLAHREAPIPSLKAARPDVPQSLDAMFRRMVAKDPADRYQSMDEVLHALDGLAITERLDTDAGEARTQADALEPKPPTPEVGSTSGIRPRRRNLALAGLVAAMLPVVFLALRSSAGTLVLAIDQPGAEIRLDGRPVAASTPPGQPLLVKLDRGLHELTVAKDGFVTVTRQLNVRPGKRSEIDVHLQRRARRATTPDPRADVHRDLALYILRMGGRLKVTTGALPAGIEAIPFLPEIADSASLPAVPFQLVSAVFNDGICTDEILSNLARVDTLCTIWAAWSPITDKGLRAISGQTHLLSLQIDGSRVTDGGLGALAGMVRLEELYLDGTSLTGTGLASLSHLALKHLVLGHESADDRGIEAISRLRELQVLHIYSKKLTPSGLKYLGRLESLKEFLLEAPGLGEFDSDLLKSWTGLERLVLGQVRVGRAWPSDLAALDGLTSLKLHDTDVTDAGLTRLMNLPRLDTMALHGARHGNSSAKAFAGAHRVRTLKLDHTSIDDGAIEALSAMSNLKELHLMETKVTASGLDRLRQALPNCTVISRN